MTPWLQGFGGKPPPLISKAITAQNVNRIIGGNDINAYNVDDLPSEDIRDMEAYIHLSGEVQRVNNAKRDK